MASYSVDMSEENIGRFGGLSTEDLAQLTFSSAMYDPQISPDGRWIAYQRSDGSGGTLMFLMAFDGTEERPLTNVRVASPGHVGNGAMYCWRPDSQAIAFFGVDQRLYESAMNGVIKTCSDALNSPAYITYANGARHLVVTNDELSSLAVFSLSEGVSGGFDRSWSRNLDCEAKLGEGLKSLELDFVAFPTFSVSSSRLYFVGWRNPHMPWDASGLYCFDGIDNGQGTFATCFERKDVSLSQPKALANGKIAVISDVTGYFSPCLYIEEEGLTPIFDGPFERADPDFGIGARSYAFMGDKILCSTNRDGFGTLDAKLFGADKEESLKRGIFTSLSSSGDRVVGIRRGVRAPSSIFTYAASSGQFNQLRVATVVGVPSSNAGEPSVARFASSSSLAKDHQVKQFDMDVPEMEISARLYYSAGNACGTAFLIHGGPTGQNRAIYSPKVEVLRLLGFDVCDVDYRGSSGRGRAYRNALNSLYGVADIVDVACARIALAKMGLLRSEKTIALGSSSAGLTVLGLMNYYPTLFERGMANFPVTDLISVSTTTHRLETYYFDSLIGPVDSSREKYFARSPLNWSFGSGKVTIIHGTEDKVVSVSQSRRFVDRVASKLDITYEEFSGKGHGWSDPDSLFREAELIAELAGF